MLEVNVTAGLHVVAFLVPIELVSLQQHVGGLDMDMASQVIDVSHVFLLNCFDVDRACVRSVGPRSPDFFVRIGTRLDRLRRGW